VNGAKPGLPDSLPKDFASLFWDVDAGVLDIHAHWQYILGRILELGTTESVRWAVETYGKSKIREFVLGRGLRVLSRKTVNYWALVLGLQDDECIQRFLKGPRNPFWPN
jgi:hypothetical protein